MGLGFLILAAVGIIVLGLITGTIWFAIPVVIAAIAAFLIYTLSMRRKGDHFARAEKGPRSETGSPQDEPGGPTHVEEGYAHEGQANMTPEQARRSAT